MEEKKRREDIDIQTYFLLEEAYTILTHSEAGDAWSSQVPGNFIERISGLRYN